MRHYVSAGLLLVVVMLIAAACVPIPPANPAGAGASTATPTAAPARAGAATSDSYADPFAYCAAVGTIDKPDARYTGDKVPDAVAQGLIKAMGLTNSTEPLDVFKNATIWRCMNQQVLACNFGANLPCDSKANTSKTPAPEMNDFCKANPTSDFIPAAVTGHDSIYSWHCVNGVAEVLDQIDQVDPAGYLARIWYVIQP